MLCGTSSLRRSVHVFDTAWEPVAARLRYFSLTVCSRRSTLSSPSVMWRQSSERKRQSLLRSLVAQGKTPKTWTGTALRGQRARAKGCSYLPPSQTSHHGNEIRRQASMWTLWKRSVPSSFSLFRRSTDLDLKNVHSPPWTSSDGLLLHIKQTKTNLCRRGGKRRPCTVYRSSSRRVTQRQCASQ
jgi:hypothetical protein